MAPLANVNTMVIKLLKAPINATPAGPVKIANTLPAIKPEAMRITVIIAEKKVVFTNFKMVLNRRLVLQLPD